MGSLAGVFSALAGIMLVTSEYRYGTIRPTFLFTPTRSRVLGAKLVAGLLAGVVFGIVGGVLAFAIGYACLAGRGIDYALSGGQTTLCSPRHRGRHRPLGRDRRRRRGARP